MLYNPPSGSTDPNTPYVGKNVAGGTQGSKVPPAAVEYPQREMVAMIAASGQAPTNSILVQGAIALGRGIWVDNLTGSGDLAVATLGVVLPSLLKGMRIGGVATATNTVTNPKLRVLNLGASPGLYTDFLILKEDGSALAIGDIKAGRRYRYEADGAGNVLISGGGIGTSSTSTSVVALLSAPKTYYVNAATGSDSNDGLTSGTAFATVQAAVNAAARFNLNGFNVTIYVADGTYPAFSLLPMSGSGTVYITGNTATPANCVVSSSAGSAITNRGGQGYVINGFKLQSSGPAQAYALNDPSAGFWTVSGTNVHLLNIAYGPCTGGFVWTAGGSVLLGGNQIIQGGTTASNAVGFVATLCGQILTSTLAALVISIPSAVSIAVFVGASGNGTTLLLYQSLTGAGNVTGQRYRALVGGTINANGGGQNYYPGTIAGDATGGQYNP